MAKAPHLGSGAQPKLLCVDDSKQELELRKAFLELHGYQVFTAADGVSGLEVLRQFEVDAVLLDYQMPGLDGSETARRIRQLRPKTRIILFSGYLEPIAATDAALFDAVLWKGEPLRFLLNALERMTSNPEQPRPARKASAPRSTSVMKDKKTRRSA